MIVEVSKRELSVIRKFWNKVIPNNESRIIRLQHNLLNMFIQRFYDGLYSNLEDITADEISDRGEQIIHDMEQKVSSCISFEVFIAECSEHFGAITIQEVSDFDESPTAE
jgi:hypothetical protein